MIVFAKISVLFFSFTFTLVVLRPGNNLDALSWNPTSAFTGVQLSTNCDGTRIRCSRAISNLMMRKQKASDKRTSRMQRNAPIVDNDPLALLSQKSILSTSVWEKMNVNSHFDKSDRSNGGRGRSRKRVITYDALSSYYHQFKKLLTKEYRAEEREVIGRIEASLNDPIGLENAGHALFDLYPQRRGNLFSDEVYRLTKANDATTVKQYSMGNDEFSLNMTQTRHDLPSNHHFSYNDIILLTLQPKGSGDFFGLNALPTSKDSTSIEARILSTGPYYIDVAVSSGLFEATFGPAPNNIGPSGKGDYRMRLRADRFFSNIPYTRMVAALNHITRIPGKEKKKVVSATSDKGSQECTAETNAQKKTKVEGMDPIFAEAIVSTYTFDNSLSQQYNDEKACHANDLSKRISKPPFKDSVQSANQVLAYLQANPNNLFQEFNGPQLAAIGAALTRKMTLIQGPPGTGKTTVAAAIAFGFSYQCKKISEHSKVLACAFSNVGADNLAENFLRVGLKVIRVGQPSGMSQCLWEHSLEAAISKDPEAQKAIAYASLLTSNMNRERTEGRNSKKDVNLNRSKREVATAAVKDSIKARRIAAIKALRGADVIVCTSVGSADPYLRAACGFYDDEDNDYVERKHETKGTDLNLSTTRQRKQAPDLGECLTLPFVIIDEACQSVEPGTLIPIYAADSCRSVVLLGDPCQLPPTVKGDCSSTGTGSPLSMSLMSRLASVLPHPVVFSKPIDRAGIDDSYLNYKPTQRAVSLMNRRGRENKMSYRKRYNGSLLLGVQYRMHPSISAFSSAIFYDGLLSTPSFLAHERLFPYALRDFFQIGDKCDVGVRFVNIGDQKSEYRKEVTEPYDQYSYANKAEADFIVDMLKNIFRKDKLAGCSSGTIGIVTPYSGQVGLLKSTMAADPEFRTLAKDHPSSVEVKSIDSFQGRECDIIIFSATRSNPFGNIGFLSDWRRMNVALTRAKCGLIIVGDMTTLENADRHWEALTSWCRDSDCVSIVTLP